MLDLAVILTPLLVLGVLMMLGYAGCKFDTSGVITTDPLFPTPGLYMVVRVPTAFTVTTIEYHYSLNDGLTSNVVQPNPTAADTEDQGSVGVYVNNCGTGYGAWVLRCVVEASEGGGAPQRGEAVGLINFDDLSTDRPRANFSTTGSPSGGDFKVIFLGFET